MTEALSATQDAPAVPRSVGTLRLSTKSVGANSGIATFRTSGSTKVAFCRRRDAVEGIMVNTSGGLTGGDRFETTASAGTDSHLILTTQAAERGYRSQSGTARVSTRLAVSPGAVLHWLPQELILFDGTAVERRLGVDLSPGAELVLVEPVVFGRHAMGETRVSGSFHDRITLRRDGAPVYWDRIALDGAISARLAHPAIAGGMGAMASAVYAGPRAQALLPQVRRALPATGGASLPSPDLLTIRLLAQDAYLLRRSLVPILEILTRTSLPKSWSL